MEWWMSLGLIAIALVILLCTGLPIAFCFMAVTLGALYFMMGGIKAWSLLAASAESSIESFVLVAIPLFTLMGSILFRSGVIHLLFDAIDAWLGKLPGRLCIVSLVGGAILAAMTGSAIGATATLSSTLYPEMTKRGYDTKLSVGSLMVSGILASIIPPSGLAIVLGSVAHISIAKLLIGGIVPGIMLAIFYITYVIIISTIRPRMAPVYVTAQLSLPTKIKRTLLALPFLLVIIAALGVMFIGWATPSEAAGTGALSCFIVAGAYGRLSYKVIKNSFSETVGISAMIFIMFVGALAFSQVLAMTGLINEFTSVVIGLPLSPILMFISMQLILFVLNMFMDSLPCIMLTVPVFFPVVYAMHIDPIWFSIVFLVNCVLGMISPPIGMVLFTAMGVIPGLKTRDVYLASTPFVLLSVLGIVIMIAFPIVCTWLPGFVNQ
jgi:tripartite ATP-independent transporter DctM subunit